VPADDAHGIASLGVAFQRQKCESTRLPDAQKEKEGVRHVALGKTYGSRLLTVVFTVRANRIRVISARPMSRNERKVFEKED